MKNHKEEKQKKRLISQKQAGEYLGISYWTVRDLVFRGDIPHIKIRRRILMDIQDLEEYIKKNKITQRT